MSDSRFKKFSGFFVLIVFAVVSSGCSFYTRIMAQKNLVDGAAAYNERKFVEAVERFERAVSYDPNLTTIEANTAQLFLARTLHSIFAGDRKADDKAKRAIDEYKKSLDGFEQELVAAKENLDANPDDEVAKKRYEVTKKELGSIVRAIGSLYENLKMENEWKKWQEDSSVNEKLPLVVRADAYITLAAKSYTCANNITDQPPIKKTVVKDGNPVFEFTKPESTEDFDTLKKCVEEGTNYIDKAVELNNESDSAWSYKASLLLQKMRIAEMNNESEEREKYKKESEVARAKFEKLAEKRRKADEAAAREKAEKIGGEVKNDEADSDEKSDESKEDK